MAYPNPTISPPVLTSTSRPSLHSRSPSRSPVRQARDFDPLLRDLSPSATLRAFQLEPGSKHDSVQGSLAQSFETASASERALGVKAAQTCLDLRSWVRELEGWDWPGTFDVPEPARKRLRMSGMSMMSTQTVGGDSVDLGTEYWGCLPGGLADAHEQRLDEISQELDRLDVEELKGFVLSAHRRAGDGWATMDDSIGTIGALTDLRRLDDFTALITATILQALPYFSQLNRLLDMWSVRLNILRQTPSFLQDIRQARRDLDHGWAAIAVSPTTDHSTTSAHFTRDMMQEMKGVIEQQVNSLGRRLDAFLDELEGREETVPETWIEDFETLESAYGDWVVQAERKLLDNEWRLAREQEYRDAEHLRAEQLLTGGEASDMRNRSDSFVFRDHSGDEDAVAPPSSRPTSGGFDLQLPEQPQPNILRPTFSNPEMPREDSQTLPSSEGEQVQHPERLITHALSHDEPHIESPTKRSRHMPIVIDYNNPDQIQPISPLAANVAQPEVTALPASPIGDNGLPIKPVSNSVAKKRAAFANGELERASTLQRQIKSPVRSFEHASNAFTRLFKREKTPEHSRSSSQRSNVSQRSSGSKAGKRGSDAAGGEGVMWGGFKPSSPPATNPRNTYSRSRSTSQRSMGSFGGALVDTVPVAVPPIRNRSFHHDYTDMPGGFRPRSRSAEHSARSRTPKAQSPEYEGQERRLERVRSAPKVETYRPKRLSSPFRPPTARSQHGPEYPADWPLASPPDTEASSPVKEVPSGSMVLNTSGQPSHGQDGEEGEDGESSPNIASPNIPIDTDVFEGLFVGSFPATPEVEPEFEGNPLAGGLRPRRARKRSKVPTVEESMLRDELEHHHGRDSEDEDRAVPHGGDVASLDGLGLIQSEGEMQQAQSVDYFHVQPSPSHTHSRNGSASMTKAQQKRGASSSRSPTALKLHIAGSPTAHEVEAGAERFTTTRPHLLHRASIASIESHPRSAVRSIDVSRRASHASAGGSVPQTPIDPVPNFDAPGGLRRTPNTPMNYKGLVVFPTPPTVANASVPASPVSPVSQHHSPRYDSLPLRQIGGRAETESPVSAESEDDEPRPLNAAMAKRQDNKRRVTGQSAAAMSRQAVPLKPGEDTFDRHVSDVLDRLPSNAIRFKARPGAVTPTSRTAEPRNHAGPRPKATSRMSSRASLGGLTLAPAEASPRKQAADEVKVYHLTQAGREEPIKLFVRLVGEGERVMVRVGGGWADLAEYLRQYAEHHGSRTVSGGGIELQTAEPASRKVSSSATPNELKTKNIPMTPFTVGPRSGSRAGNPDLEGLRSEQTRFGTSDSTPTDGSNGSPTATVPLPLFTTHTPTATQRSTPKSTSTKDTSRPSTAGSIGRPGSRQGPLESGLAGAGAGKGKRGDLPEQKARWVEGMIEKAKAASAEKSKEEKGKFFGEVGKAGGTRRVIFRQSSTSGGGGEKEKENKVP